MAAGRAERVPEREGGAEAVFRVPQGRGTSRLENYKIRLLGQDRERWAAAQPQGAPLIRVLPRYLQLCVAMRKKVQ